MGFCLLYDCVAIFGLRYTCAAFDSDGSMIKTKRCRGTAFQSQAKGPDKILIQSAQIYMFFHHVRQLFKRFF